MVLVENLEPSELGMGSNSTRIQEATDFSEDLRGDVNSFSERGLLRLLCLEYGHLQRYRLDTVVVLWDLPAYP